MNNNNLYVNEKYLNNQRNQYAYFVEYRVSTNHLVSTHLHMISTHLYTESILIDF